MSNAFAESLRGNTNTAYTENGAVSFASTLDAVLDFFSKSGAFRGKESEALKYFTRAINEDTKLAMKALFYARDIRGGQGERGIFRHIIHYLADHYTDAIGRNMRYIPEYGRWDDLYSFVGTKLQGTAFAMMKAQFEKDMVSETPSLLGKWLASQNTSSKETRKLGKMTQERFGLTPKQYRKSLTSLRDKIKIIEDAMSHNDWKNIDYSKVPSQASKLYSKAFRKHDETRYNDFIEKALKGEAKINAGTLYPYQIGERASKTPRGNAQEVKALDALWEALPNYIKEPENAIVVADVSGSMTSGSGKVRPIDVSISLAIYFAERNTGPFKDYFITFSGRPTMEKVNGRNIVEKYENLSRAAWDGNTDLQAVFDLILQTAVAKKASQEDLPAKVYIISDMQFDQACSSGYYGRNRNPANDSNFAVIEKKYADAGYKRPDLVFWNVNASSDTPVTKDQSGTFLVSGCSPSILKYAVNCEAVNPQELMLEVLNSERYEVIS